jgi:hypothetical protein
LVAVCGAARRVEGGAPIPVSLTACAGGNTVAHPCWPPPRMFAPASAIVLTRFPQTTIHKLHRKVGRLKESSTGLQRQSGAHVVREHQRCRDAPGCPAPAHATRPSSRRSRRPQCGMSSGMVNDDALIRTQSRGAGCRQCDVGFAGNTGRRA